jgi:hypothetical protein
MLTLPLQARALCEAKVLNREVRIIPYGGDSGPRVYGELVYADDGKAASLAATLLEQGAARFSNWSARLLPVSATALVTAANLQKREIAAQVWARCMHIIQVWCRSGSNC